MGTKSKSFTLNPKLKFFASFFQKISGANGFIISLQSAVLL